MHPIVLGLGTLAAGYTFLTKCILPRKQVSSTAPAVDTAARCAFCKGNALGEGVIERQSIGEGRNTRVLLDNNPIVPGHMLLTTTKHSQKAHNLRSFVVLEANEALKQIVGIYQKKYNTGSYLQIQKNGKAAGQSVPHFHTHIYPISSKNMLYKAYLSFFVKFATGCGSKLQGEKLRALKTDLSPMCIIPNVEARASEQASRGDVKEGEESKGKEEKSERVKSEESAKKIEGVASCVLCQAIEKNDQNLPLVRILAYDRPITPGHVIITTTRHIEKAHELTADELSEYDKALVKVVGVFQTTYSTEDYVQIQESGAFAGQEGTHFYTHVYPVEKTNHEYVAQFTAFVKYIFGCASKLEGKKLEAVQKLFAH